jgi:flavin-dependent dehydrogenase
LPSGERLVAFLGDRDLVDRRALLGRESLWAKLQATELLRALCERHGYAQLHEPHGADASSGRLERCVGDRWLAVGDAALSFDPLASKGIANALYTGIRGAQALLATLRGDATALPRYDEHLQQIYRVYREQLALHYAIETRWPHAPFWRRRARP